jgi:hypothetical protein
MSQRAIRRAAERAAAKLAAQNNNKVMTTSVGSAVDAPEPRPISDAKLIANRLNGALSHGAITPEGREASSRNAITHSLTSKNALQPGDDAEAYHQLVASHVARYEPATDEESELVHLIANNAWRMLKILPREDALYALGRIKYPNLLADQNIIDPIRLNELINAELSLIFAKDFHNLHLQERRIRNQHKADIARLQEVQQQRLEKAQRDAQAAAAENIHQITRLQAIEKQCSLHNRTFQPTDFGVDFSLSEWTHFRDRQATHFLLSKEYLDLKKVIALYRDSNKEKENGETAASRHISHQTPHHM